MQISEIDFEGGARPIDSYGPGFFRIGGAVHQGALVVSAQSAREWTGLDNLAPIEALIGEIDVLLIGTGAEFAAVPAALRSRLEGAGIGVEVMATPTACRSFNVLLAEGRRVAAALIPV